MNRHGGIFFILACARSGSTSLARILGGADNGTCAVEPSPNLNWETRELLEGRLTDPKQVVENAIGPRVGEALMTAEVYGEKNLTYGPFIPYLYERFRCRFILVVRDGAEVVRSLMDWHNRMFGSVYRECVNPGELTPRALAGAANLPLHLDTSDYSRPRPLPGSQFYDEWELFSRDQMCAYYWSQIYNRYLDELEALPDDCWMRINYTSVNAGAVLKVAEFVGLPGLEELEVQAQLDSRINSLEDRIDESSRYPGWDYWSDVQRSCFVRIAGQCLQRLGFSEK